jgi:hypothetical protein
MPYQLESRYPSERMRILKAAPPANFERLLIKTGRY